MPLEVITTIAALTISLFSLRLNMKINPCLQDNEKIKRASNMTSHTDKDLYDSNEFAICLLINFFIIFLKKSAFASKAKRTSNFLFLVLGVLILIPLLG